MRKILFIFILIIISGENSWGQSGQWGYAIHLNIYNNHKHSLKAGGSHTKIHIYTVRNGKEINEDYFSGNFSLKKGNWISFYTPIKVRTLSEKYNELKINMRADCDGGHHSSTSWSENMITLFTGSNVGYEQARICDGDYSNSGCTRRHNLYRRVTGYADLYTFPKNIIISYKSGTSQILPTLDKIKIEAPAGYTQDTYKWVYSTNNGGTWRDISNTTLQGSRILEASGKDVYGDDYESEMNIGGTTWIALEYYVYKDRSNTRAIERSNYFVLTNLKSTPGILDITALDKICYGAANGRLKVQLDKALLSDERLTVDYKNLTTSAIGNVSDPVMESDNSFYIENLDAGNYEIQVSGFYKGVTTYSDDPDHKKEGKIENFPTLTYSTGSKTDITCFGSNNGSITVKASGGDGSYKLHWRKQGGSYITRAFMSSTQTIVSDLEPGIYEYYVTDTHDCELRDQESNIVTRAETLVQPTKALDFAFQASSEPSGHGRSDGSIILTGDGGSPLEGNTYIVGWKNKNTNQPVITVDNDPSGSKFKTTVKNISAGTYTVEIKDKNNCVFTDEITVSEPKELIVLIEKSQQILCNGDTNGELVVHARGGVLEPEQVYTYQWYKKNGTIYEIIPLTDSIASNLGKGDYKVAVKDQSRTVNISEKEISLDHPPLLTANLSKQDVTCFGGNNGFIRIEVAGGVGGYKLYYKQKDNTDYGQPLDSQGNIFLLDNLMANRYDIYITDSNDCVALIGGSSVAQIIINQPQKALGINNALVKTVSGFGRSDGSITIKIEGGTPNTLAPLYNVTWKNALGLPITDNASINNGIFTSQIENLPQGIYTVEIRDKNYANLANGCYVTSTFSVIQPEELSLHLENTNGVYCYGEETGELVAHVQGGVSGNFSGAPYNYKWYKVINGNTTLIPNENDSILAKRSAGFYKVKIEDASSPSNIIESAVLEIAQPVLLTTIPATRNIGCCGENTGFIHISVSGGIGNYKLFCKKDGIDTTYRQYDISTNDNTFYLDDLYYGKYSVYILDGNNCYAKINGNNIHEFVLTQPIDPLFIETLNQIDISGFERLDGEIKIKVTGGTINTTIPYYNVIWKDAVGTVLTSIDAFDSYGIFTSKIKNKPKGVYTVEIKDSNYNGTINTCYATATFTLTQPDPLAVELEQIDSIYCHGEATGTLVAHVKGGVPNSQTIYPYTYKWYKIENSKVTLIPNETDSILKQRPAGQYKVCIQDFSRVTNAVESTGYEIVQPAPLITTLNTRNISCYGLNDGFIMLEVAGGVGGYRLFCKKDMEAGYTEYPINSDNTTFIIDNLYAGTYSFYMQDANGCYAQIYSEDICKIILTQPTTSLIISAMIKTDASGFGRSDGNIKVTINGGTPNMDGSYNVLWKNDIGQTLSGTGTIENGKYVSLLNNVPQGKYNIEIKDKNYAEAYTDANTSCIVQELYSISEPDELLAEIEETHFISCNGMSDGQLVIRGKGGIRNPVSGRLPYVYKWYRQEAGTGYTLLVNERDSILSNIATGSYKAEIEDYSRIVNTVSVIYNLRQPGVLQASATETEIICGQTTQIHVTATGGTAPYAYQWSTGDKTESVNNISPGSYFVFVSDSRGCETTAVAKVSTPADLQVTTLSTNPICYGADNGSIILQVTGGTAPYTYKWNDGIIVKDRNNLEAGLYTVLVTDKNGCTYTDNLVLSNPELLTVDLGEDRTLCNGQSLTLAPTITDTKTKFSWIGPNSFKAITPEITVYKAGLYKLTITDSKGCQATDEISINVKNIDISSEIFVATEVFAGDTIVIANISNSNPDHVEWLIDDTDSLKVVEMDEHYARVLFFETGYYKIGFRTHKGNCFQDIFKTITVVDKDRREEDSFGESIIDKYYIYPNPNDGDFNVRIILNKTSAIRLRIINIGIGNIVSDKKYVGQKEYDIPYNKSIAPGNYVIVLETASGYMNLKMIVR